MDSCVARVPCALGLKVLLRPTIKPLNDFGTKKVFAHFHTCFSGPKVRYPKKRSSRISMHFFLHVCRRAPGRVTPLAPPCYATVNGYHEEICTTVLQFQLFYGLFSMREPVSLFVCLLDLELNCKIQPLPDYKRQTRLNCFWKIIAKVFSIFFITIVFCTALKCITNGVAIKLLFWAIDLYPLITSLKVSNQNSFICLSLRFMRGQRSMR